MLELSPAFRTIFTAAVNIEAVHVGFPSHRPLTVLLESIFHNVQWNKLVAFGIQGWRLDAREIIEVARRHQGRLRGLRLRDVLLKEGSKWKDVLQYLRSNLKRLDWVSLRRIDYETNFDRFRANAGVEVPHDPPGGDSDSEEEDSSIDSDSDHDSEQESVREPSNDDSATPDSGSDHSVDSGREHSDDERGAQAEANEFPS